jgi:hypothetical protein
MLITGKARSYGKTVEICLEHAPITSIRNLKINIIPGMGTFAIPGIILILKFVMDRLGVLL